MKEIRVFLGGSGALYPLYAGCLIALQDSDHKIVEISGTSGGSIIAALWTCTDIPKNEESVLSFLKETLPKNHPGSVQYSLSHFLKNWGLVDGSNLEKLFESVFYKKLGQAHIPLSIFAADITRTKQYAFTSQTHPEMSVAKAVRASCSIPLIFDATVVDGEKIVDGGWICPMPDSELYPDVLAIGINVVQTKPSFMVETLIDYIQDVLYRNIQPVNIEQNDIISLVSKHDRKNITNITEEDTEELFKEGYDQVSDWLGENSI